MISMKLADLCILAVDCQATGATPAKGHLLEIGWVTTRAAQAANPQSLAAETVFVRLPLDADIPPAVQRVTGLTLPALNEALAPGDIWKRLSLTAGRVAAANRMNRCPAIIHYARFEAPFLDHLHSENNFRAPFPLRIICTHEIARRLLPGLPRKGLRAVAGYFGHSVPRLRRAGDHAVATALIWRHLVELLRMDHAVGDLQQLADWLRSSAAKPRTKRIFPMSPALRSSLPDAPGIYRMRRSNGDLLYIGKARSLKKRVNSYFRPKAVRAGHTLEMLSQAADLDVTVTGSALEAAVLESDEIKRLDPPYNIALQKAERRLIFFSRDLRQCAYEADPFHCIGPLPDGNVTQAMLVFGRLLETSPSAGRKDLRGIGEVIAGATAADDLPRKCLAEGIDRFRREHLQRPTHRSAVRAMAAVGLALWRNRLAAQADTSAEPLQEKREDEAGDQRRAPQQQPAWTPEAVARRLENTAMQSALLIRRSRWLCLLSESSLSWVVRDSQRRSKHLLLLENGAVSGCAQLSLEEKTPVPAGYARRMPQRQKMFTVSTYERLRVMTTELRRLVSEGREIEIRVQPKAVLTRRHLAALLPWI